MPIRSSRTSSRSSRRDSFQRAGIEPPRRLFVPVVTVDGRTGPHAQPAGSGVHARVYEPEGAIHGNVLIHAATACPQRFYEGFARFLTEAGLRVFTYDYRGIGESRRGSVRAEPVSMAGWAQVDARAMHDYLEAHYPGVPLVIVGHSFGAQLIGLLDEARQARAAVFVGAQLGYYGHWPQPQATALRALWTLLVPALCRTIGYVPRQLGMGEDLPPGVALQWARWCSHPGYLIGEFPEASARFARFARPIVAYGFADDTYAPPRAIEALHAQLTFARITDRRLTPAELGVPGVGHFGFFRPRVGARLWPEAREFLLQAVLLPQLSASA